MPHAAKTLALLFTLLTFASVVHAKDDGHDKDRAAIKAAYADVDTAWNSKDENKAVAFMADDFALYGLDNKIEARGRKDMSGYMRELFTYKEDLVAHTIHTHIVFTKQGAIVTVIRHQSYKAFERYNEMDSIENVTSRDIWGKSVDGWHEKRSRLLHRIGTLNGEYYDDRSNRNAFL